MALSTGSRFKIHSRGEFRSVEEDETAQIQEIFKHFDHGNRGRVATVELPTILRLL
jgi:Ca2+-binding EF-hand superfamily protein